jgi:hypothetical protein
MRCPSLLGLGLLLAMSASAQQGELRARELFYTPVTDLKAKAPEQKQTEAKPVAKNETRPPARRAKTEAPVQANRNGDHSKLTDGAHIQHASTGGDVVGPPLALKYRLLKRNAEGAYDEVDTDTVFRSGDKIRVSVESNDNAHLYIVQQGSSKTWNLLFPNEEVDSNRVERNREYEIPGSGNRFTFDEQAGTERMFLILSRRPEADLEKLIYALSQGTNAAKPASTNKAADQSKLMIAQNRIDDGLIGQLRERDKVLARDLVFEKVNDDEKASARPAGVRKEKALYVATPDRTAAARIVVDLNLKHQ